MKNSRYIIYNCFVHQLVIFHTFQNQKFLIIAHLSMRKCYNFQYFFPPKRKFLKKKIINAKFLIFLYS